MLKDHTQNTFIIKTRNRHVITKSNKEDWLFHLQQFLEHLEVLKHLVVQGDQQIREVQPHLVVQVCLGLPCWQLVQRGLGHLEVQADQPHLGVLLRHHVQILLGVPKSKPSDYFPWWATLLQRSHDLNRRYRHTTARAHTHSLLSFSRQKVQAGKLNWYQSRDEWINGLQSHSQLVDWHTDSFPDTLATLTPSLAHSLRHLCQLCSQNGNLVSVFQLKHEEFILSNVCLPMKKNQLTNFFICI